MYMHANDPGGVIALLEEFSAAESNRQGQIVRWCVVVLRRSGCHVWFSSRPTPVPSYYMYSMYSIDTGGDGDEADGAARPRRGEAAA